MDTLKVTAEYKLSQWMKVIQFYEKKNFREIKTIELPEKFPVMDVDKKFYCYHLQ